LRRVRSTGAILAAGGLVLAAAALLLPLYAPDPSIVNVGVFTLMYVGLATAWNIIGGYTGYISLGHAGFFGIGAYGLGLLVARLGVPGGYGPFLVVPLAGVITAAVAVPVGWMALRTRAATFVIVTIAFMFMLQILAINLRGLTRGSQGLGYPVPQGWGTDFYDVPFYYAMLALAAGALAVSWLIRRSRLGLGLLAIRDDEDRALALGVPAWGFKMTAFALSAGLVGMIGGVYGYYVTYVYPQFVIDPLVGLSMVLMAFLGGVGTVFGPVLGALLLEPAQTELAYSLGSARVYLILYAAVFLVVILLLPRGIVPSLTDRLEAWRASRDGQDGQVRRPDVPPAPGRGTLAWVRSESSSGNGREAGALLTIEGLSKHFGGVVAVDSCSLVVAEGSVTGLIGPNGSGKTTLFDLVTGFARPDSGRVTFRSAPITGLPPGRVHDLGIGRTFQLARVFRRLTVLENLLVPVRSTEAARAREVLDFLGLARLADQPAGRLSYGQRKLLELGTLMMSRPQLVLLDEPAGGVNPGLLESIAASIRELNAQGVTFLIVEHNMAFVMGLCDPVVVMDRGHAIATGSPAQVRADPLVLDAYLGA
jgi:ABC-type branched-subunit amino acid transport system ATPase component/ABC-type branched-subunit amino acid transport system permease subunit